MKKILITGGFGMIGRRFIGQLKKKGNKIISLRYFLSKLQPIIKIKLPKNRYIK